MDQPIKDFHEFVVYDVLGHIEGITSKAMFGGYGLCLDGKIFGIITGVDELRFKVDDTNRAVYEQMGSTPFVYTGHKNKKPVVMNYYLVPETVMENREEIERLVVVSAALGKR